MRLKNTIFAIFLVSLLPCLASGQIQKAIVNGVPVAVDAGAPTVPTFDSAGDGGDVAYGAAAFEATRRSPHVVDLLADLQTIGSDYLIDGQTYRTLGYKAVGDKMGRYYVYHETGRSGVTTSTLVTPSGPGADDYFESATDSYIMADDDFTNGLNRIANWNGGTSSIVSDALNIVSSNGGARGVQFNYELEPGKLYTVQLEIDLNNADYVHFLTDWPNSHVEKIDRMLRRDGVHSFTFRASGTFFRLLARLDTGSSSCTAIVEWIRVTQGGSESSLANTSVLLGDGAFDGTLEFADGTIQSGRGNVVISPYGGIYNTTTSGNHVNIGPAAFIGSLDADAGADIVNIGPGAMRVVDDTYDDTATTGDSVGIGHDVKVWSWRGVAVGPRAVAGATSSTSVGANAVCTKPHGVALGRGAWCPFDTDRDTGLDHPDVVLGGGILGDTNPDGNIYFGTTWANYFDELPETGGTQVGNRTSPADDSIRLHGPDAWDSRASSSQTNEAGGTLALVGGLSTGTAAGGSVDFETSPAGSTGNNKNTPIVAGRFDSQATGGDETRFLLLDLSDGTVKRVEFGADDSAGAGRKVLCVDN